MIGCAAYYNFIAGKKFELYESDVMDFISKLQSGEIKIK